MSRYAHVLRTVFETPWAITPTGARTIVEILQLRANGVKLTPDEIRERVEAVQSEQGDRRGAMGLDSGDGGYVAVLPIYGTLFPRASLFEQLSGATGLNEIQAAFKAAVNDPEVKAIILDIDSPGGSTAGITEFANVIREARDTKPVIAAANYLAASAAYHLASAAGEVVVTPSGLVGSVGTYVIHEDVSGALEQKGVKITFVSRGEHKTDGNPYEPLSDDARREMQAIVDEAYSLMIADIAKGRRVSQKKVEADFGQGTVMAPRAALDNGLVDRIEAFPDTVARVMQDVQRRSRRGSRATTFQTAYVELPSSMTVTTGGAAFNAATSGADTATLVAELNDALDERFRLTVDQARAALAVPVPEPVPSADRPDQMDTPATREETPEMDAPAATPAAAQADPARDELFTAVRELSVAVREMNEGRADRDKVERLMEEVEELRKAQEAQLPETGFVPDDIVTGRRKVGIVEMHQLPSRTVAKLTGAHAEDIDEFQRVSDNLLILSAATKKNPRDLRYYSDTFLPTVQAAMDSTTAAEGDEFVPTLLSGNLIERVELALKVVALFPGIEMPSNPYEIPGFGVRTRGGRASENTADTGQTGFRKVTPATRKITLTAVKFAAEALVSKEAEEDSLIPILDFIRNELTSQMAHDQEDAILNGDTTGTHMDADVTDALDPRKNWAGLRKLAQAAAKTDGSNAILTDAMLRVNRKKMGKYGVDSSQVTHLMGIKSYVNLLGGSNVLTVDKYGPNAVILAGELGRIDGIPIVVSEYVREDLNATGVEDGVTTDRSVAITVYRNGYLIGNRRGMTVQLLTELYAEYDQDAITVSHRKAFQPRYPSATDLAVALTYNLAP